MWELFLFGRVSLFDLSGAVVQLRSRNEYELLAMLAYSKEKGLFRSDLVGLLWPESDRDSGRASLRNALSGLRRVLGKGAITKSGEMVLLAPGLIKFTEFSAHEGSEYPGDFMPGFNSDWVLDHRVLIREAWVDIQIQAAARMWEEGDIESAMSVLDRACAVDELNDDAASLRVLYLKAMGKHVDSVKAQDRHRGRVLQSLGLDTSGADRETVSNCPMLSTGEWLIERDPQSALEYLASTADFWPSRDISAGLAIHNRVLSLCESGAPGRREVYATKLHLEWAAGKLDNRYILAGELMTQGLESGELRLAFRYGVVGMYGRLSVGDFRGAVKTAQALNEGMNLVNDQRIQGQVDINVGIIFQHSGRLKESEKLIFGGGLQLLEHGTAEDAASASQVIAHYYFEQGRLNLASDALAHARRYFGGSGAVRGEGWTIFAEADMLFGLGELSKSLEMLNGLILQGTAVLGHSLIGVASDLAGRIYSELGEFDAAAESMYGSAIWRKNLGVKRSLYERKGLAPAWVKVQQRLSRSDLARAYDRARSNSPRTV